MLRGTGKPFVIAVNKVDAVGQESQAAEFHKFGVKIFPIAAEHGTGVDELLDHALKVMSAQDTVHADDSAKDEITEIAIIGRPNVGKSTLLNRMAGEERSIVSPIPGTTIDSVDTDVIRDGRQYRFVDTAGNRRQSKKKIGVERIKVEIAPRGDQRAR